MRQVALIAISLFVVGRLYAMQGVEAALTGLGGVALFGSMVWYSEFWAEYVLPLGFWASKASDFDRPGRSAVGITLIGWVLLLLLAGAVLMMPADSWR